MWRSLTSSWSYVQPTHPNTHPSQCFTKPWWEPQSMILQHPNTKLMFRYHIDLSVAVLYLGSHPDQNYFFISSFGVASNGPLLSLGYATSSLSRTRPRGFDSVDDAIANKVQPYVVSSYPILLPYNPFLQRKTPTLDISMRRILTMWRALLEVKKSSIFLTAYLTIPTPRSVKTVLAYSSLAWNLSVTNPAVICIVMLIMAESLLLWRYHTRKLRKTRNYI